MPLSVLLPEAVGFGLAAVGPATFVALALLHAGTEGDVDTRWSGEAEGLGDLDEVEAVDVEDATQAV